MDEVVVVVDVLRQYPEATGERCLIFPSRLTVDEPKINEKAEQLCETTASEFGRQTIQIQKPARRMNLWARKFDTATGREFFKERQLSPCCGERKRK